MSVFLNELIYQCYRHLILMVIFGVTTTSLSAQERLFENQVVKFNVLPLGLRSYNVGYETTWNDRWSTSISLNVRPSNSFPNREKIEGYYSDQDIYVHQTKLSHFSVTPELRRYFNSTNGLQGLYIGMFLQYARFGYQGRIDYIGGGPSNASIFAFDGGISTFTAGASIGKQWSLGQSIYLDWQIFAPSFGFNNGLIEGTRIGGNPLDNIGMSVLEYKPNEFNIPLVKLDIDARPDLVRVNTRGAWTGLRLWLALGYRF